MSAPKYEGITIPYRKGQIEVRVKSGNATAFTMLTRQKLFPGVKLLDLVAEVYRRGRKDGTREVFDRVDLLKKEIPHKNPTASKRKKRA